MDNVRAVLVVVDGHTRLEYYRNGFTAYDHEHAWSVTKSAISTLVGIAIGEGLIPSLGGVAALHLHGAPFLLHEAVPGKRQETSATAAGLTTTRIEMFLDTPEDLVARAARSGASAVEPVTDHDAPWGTHRQGGFTDPFGHRWSVGDRSPLQALPSYLRASPPQRPAALAQLTGRALKSGCLSSPFNDSKRDWR